MESVTLYEIFKDVVAFVGGLATLLIATFGVFLALRQWKESTDEQRRQRRWNQADKGRTLVDDLLKSDDEDGEYYAWDAMRMLDYVDSTPPYRTKNIPGHNGGAPVTTAAIDAALKPTALTEANPVELYIRECFDEFYFKMAQLQDAIDNGLVELRHVEFPVGYYIGLMAEDPADARLHHEYLVAYGYQKTLKFLASFPAWKAGLAKAGLAAPAAR